MFCLFVNKKSNPKGFFEVLREITKNRENNLNNNKNNSNGNDEMMMMNQMIWSKLTRQIQEFQWIYLQDKCLLEIVKSFENDYQARKGKLAILREIMKAIIQRAIEEYNCLQKIESADEAYELLSQEVSRLQELYVKCAVLTMDKMIEFEKKGIRPTSFFQGSFQLLEENEENLVGPI
ncbi:hypothetical protein Glove_71g104 [Diversispora epigaea]|uniref:Uncharacterized protein n=1 Tax=Diversispora epigaea TaxID=1348612 RepID=A0A397JA02_9GLOM|nr:hypothetical protein Glove_71g104 [Diversispora epigaea]